MQNLLPLFIRKLSAYSYASPHILLQKNVYLTKLNHNIKNEYHFCYFNVL